MSESFEGSREGAVASFQKKIAQIVERCSKIDGTIVHVTDVGELGASELQAWELYGDLLRKSIASGASSYADLAKETMMIAKDFRTRLLQANADDKVSRSFYYNWMINRLSVLAMNLPIASEEKFTKDIIQDITNELNEYFGS